MRKQIWIASAVILAVCMLMIIYRSTKQQANGSPIKSVTQTNGPPTAAQSPVANQAQAPLPIESARYAPQVPDTGTVPRPGSAIELSNAIHQQMQADWQKPIEFYGKVVDENGNPVPAASVQFRWSGASDEVFTATTRSSADGLFSLEGKNGRALDVSVGKDGYYSSRTNRTGFLYSLGPDIYTAQAWNPIVFHLRKQGTLAEALVPMKQNYRIPRGGTPVSIDLTTGAHMTGENGNLVVRCWTSDQGKRSDGKYDWRCVVTVPGGGVVLTDEEFAFAAPEGGYKPTLEINMPAGITNWNSQVDSKFYYRLADGRYGKMTFSMVAGGQHFFMVDSLLNPTGSRNLEPAQ